MYYRYHVFYFRDCIKLIICLPRPVATGGEGGGAQPPLERFEPPLGCAVPFAVTIGIEVYPPWNSVSPPC